MKLRVQLIGDSPCTSSGSTHEKCTCEEFKKKKKQLEEGQEEKEHNTYPRVKKQISKLIADAMHFCPRSVLTYGMN